MSTGYPGSLDVLTNPISTQTLDDPTVLHDQQHANANDAIEAIQTTLGINPQGASVSVDARLDAMDTLFGNKVNTSLLNVANGVATTDASNKLVQNVDAAKVNSGVLAVARIPSLDAAIIATGVLGTARIPNLDASKITSGVLGAAQIPNLDASKITTGTVALARLPGGLVGINTVVADSAARLALTGKIDGMIVLENSTTYAYWWKATTSSWIYIGGGFPLPANVSEDTDFSAVASVPFIAGSPGCGVTFVAPPSGKVYITVSGYLQENTSGSFAFLGIELRTGGTIGSGTILRSPTTNEAVGCSVGRESASRELYVVGLTAGSTYNVRTMFCSTPAGTFDCYYREILVKPVYGV